MAASELIPWINSAGEGGVRNSMQEFPGAGTNGPFEFNFAGGYIDQSYVKAYRYDPVSAATYDQTLTFVGTNTVTTSDVIPLGQFVIVYRDTPKDKPLVDFTDGAVMDEENLDLSNQQAISVAAEMLDRFDSINATSSDAINRSVTALNTANTALANSQAAQTAAANAVSTANAANSTANAAQTAAGNAVSTANGIDAKASTALSNSAAAVSTANNASGVANSIAGTAQSALDNANAAVSTANSAALNASSALSTANGIADTANNALSNSQSAVSTASAAQSAAASAMPKAGGEFTGPVTFDDTVTMKKRPTFNGATPFDTANFFDAQGYGYLSYTSASLLTMTRKNGRTIPINGKACIIPAGGITCSSNGTANNTLYYIYALSSDGISVTALEFSTTGYSADPNYGTTTKSGDTSRTLVGCAFVTTAGNWQDTSSLLAVLSYFCRKDRVVKISGSGQQTSSTSPVEFLPILGLVWSDETADAFACGSRCNVNSNVATMLNGMYVDGVQQDDLQPAVALGNGYTAPLSLRTAVSNLTTGLHRFALYGWVDNTNIANKNVGTSITLRTRG